MSRDDHYRKLERLYLGAPTNAYYRPSIQIAEGRAEVEIAVRPEFMHVRSTSSCSTMPASSLSTPWSKTCSF
jgi:hypothetical protein